MRVELPETPLDFRRLDALLLAEIQDFRRGFEDAPVPIEQDLRAGAIAWIATFAPEAVASETRRVLYLTCDATRKMPDYDHHGWYRAVYLDIAQYTLTREPGWLTTLVSNLDHHSSQLRASLHAPFGLVAPTLNLSWGELKQRIENNLRAAHLYNDSLMCLFCVLQADPAVKRAQAMRWRQGIKLAPQDIDTLDKLIAGNLLSNALIAEEYAEISRYLVCRLLNAALVGSGPASHEDALDTRRQALTVNALWRRMASHPLIAPLVALKQRQS
jgi:hypothetical protein